MKFNCFKILRLGTHTTFQDNGFSNLQHLGITNSGVVDKGLFFLANKLVNNDYQIPVIEFASQGPSLKLMNGVCRFAITGKALFNIISKKKIIKGITNKTYTIFKDDIIDILTTVGSNYAYFSIEGGFNLKKEFNSYSTLTKSDIGFNKIELDQFLYFKINGSSKINKISYIEDKTNFIRVVNGPQANYFFPKIIKKFYSDKFIIGKNSNRMGIRLENNVCKSVISQNISSEGIIKGSIQVPGDGNPIILLNDHPTIGGYPKIAIVILADIHKIAQFTVGTSFIFKQVTITEAELIYKQYIKKLSILMKYDISK